MGVYRRSTCKDALILFIRIYSLLNNLDMAEQFDNELILSPIDVGIDLKILIEDILHSFRNVTKFSIKFKQSFTKPIKDGVFCEISCSELFDGLQSKSVSFENFNLFLTQHFDWRIFFIRNFTPEHLPLLRELTISFLQYLEPDMETALTSILVMEQLECLTIRYSDLSLYKSQLQFWNLTNLIQLNLPYNGLTLIPASIGMLNRLEILNVNSNPIPAGKFPFTLLNCEKLRELYYENPYQFYLPYIVQKMTSLCTIRSTTSKYFEEVNQNLHNTIVSTDKAPHRKLFSPLPLQILACEIIVEQNPTCWRDRLLAPMLCRVLDRAIDECKLCFVCNNVYSDACEGFLLKSVLPSFLGVSIAAFMQWCCSDKCIEIAKREQKDLNATLTLAKDLEEIEISSYYENELYEIRGSGNYLPHYIPKRKRKMQKCIIS